MYKFADKTSVLQQPRPPCTTITPHRVIATARPLFHQRVANTLTPLVMPEQQNSNPPRLFTIWQQNTNKSLLSQLDLLESLKWDNYNICAIQEPYIDFKGSSRANWQWTTIYPSTHQTHPDSMRLLILINTNILTDSWKQLNIQHPDITGFTAIEIQGHFSIHIINIYNNCNNNHSLSQMSNFIRDHAHQLGQPMLIHTIWLGDFNHWWVWSQFSHVKQLFFHFLALGV